MMMVHQQSDDPSLTSSTRMNHEQRSKDDPPCSCRSLTDRCSCAGIGNIHQHHHPPRISTTRRLPSRRIVQRRCPSQCVFGSALLSSFVLVFLQILIIRNISILTMGVDAQPLDTQPYEKVSDMDGTNHHMHPSNAMPALRGNENSEQQQEEEEDHEEEDNDDDDERYILDYNRMDELDVHHYRKLVTIFDRPTASQPPQQRPSLWTFATRRNISNVTWIIRVNNNATTNLIASKIVPKKILFRLNLVFQGLIVKGISRSTLTWLLRRSDVLLIEENQPVHSLDAPTRPPTTSATLKDGQPWGIDLVDGRFDQKYTYTYSGNGVTVFVFDTGIMSTHDEFTTGRVTCGLNVVTEEVCEDLKGHGTHIAGTVGGKTYGLARKVSLVNVKVLDKTGGGTVSKVLQGLEYVALQKLLSPSTPMIIGLSLGSNYSATFNDAVTRCVDAGIIVVVASGNEQVDACTTSPSSAEKAITVGGMDVTLLRPVWSNYGDCVNLYAPAVAVLSATYDSKDKKKTTYRSGTSMAVPHVVGVIAMYLEWNPQLTPDNINEYLMMDSTYGILMNLDLDGNDNDPNNLLISSAKIQTYVPSTLAPTLSPLRITSPVSEAPAPPQLERPTCGGLFTTCLTDDDCCFSCLSLDFFNLGVWGQRCFWFG